MVQTPIDNGYSRIYVPKFRFRNLAALKIPKSVREVALDLAVEIEVVSVLKPPYYNYSVYPAESFHGYAVLVFYDYIYKIIPLKFGRNSVYYERNDAGYNNWESFKSVCYSGYFSSRVAETIAELATALELIVTAPPCESVDFQGFPELPLREIYVKAPYGTNLAIEFHYERALAFQDACGKVTQPTSGKVDNATKDNGLPTTGTQPQVAEDKDDPDKGFPPPTSEADLGDWNNMDKLPQDGYPNSGLDQPNLANTPITNTIRYMRVLSTVRRPEFNGGCANRRVDTSYYLVNDDTELVGLTPWLFQSGCDGQTVSAWKVQLTGGEPFNVGYSDSAPSITFGRASALPGDSSIFDF